MFTVELAGWNQTASLAQVSTRVCGFVLIATSRLMSAVWRCHRCVDALPEVQGQRWPVARLCVGLAATSWLGRTCREAAAVCGVIGPCVRVAAVALVPETWTTGKAQRDGQVTTVTNLSLTSQVVAKASCLGTRRVDRR